MCQNKDSLIWESSFCWLAMIICWPGRDSRPRKFLPSSKHVFEFPRCVFEGLCIVLPATTVIPQCSWTPGYLLMLHISSIPGWAPSLVVTAGTSITPVLPILCNTFSSFSSGLTEHPSHQRFMIFHRRDKKSLSFLSCCSVASWVTKAESLDYSIFPNLISVQHAYLQSSLLKGLSVRPQG